MPYSDKTQFSSWPHSPSSGASVPSGTASPKAGWLGNLTTISEWLDWAWGAFRAATGHTHTGADGDGPQIPTGGITDLAVTTGKIAASAVTSAKVDSTVTTNAFKTIAVSGQDNVVADSAADTLNISGSGITVTTNATTDTVNLTATAASVGAAPSSHVGAGGAEHANAIAAGAAGFMTGADKTKLDGVTSGATASSIAKNGSAAITGAATLSEGTAITLTQVGSDISIATTAMSNPMTTAGDLIIGGTAGAPARLAKGADGTVLTMAAGAETWATPASAPVSSVFGRTGAVAATSGDYTAALVTNAADKSSASEQTFTGNVAAPLVRASGLTGATEASRYVGATASGAPATGTFAIGDFVIDRTGPVWVCTTAGTPGTWKQVGVSLIQPEHYIDVYHTAVSHVNWDTITASSSVLHGAYKQSSGAQNDEISFDRLLAVGTYTFELCHTTNTDRGQYTVYFDGSTVGSPIEGYSSPAVVNVRSQITSITVAATGVVRIKLKMVDKNASSSSYTGYIHSAYVLKTA